MNRAVYKMKKMWKYAAVVLVCVLTLGACGNLDSSKTSGDAAQDRKIQIGMSFDSFVIDRPGYLRIHSQGTGGGGQCTECQRGSGTAEETDQLFH